MPPDLVAQVELSPAAEAARRDRFPVGASIAFADLEEHGRIGALDRLRDAEPVSWVPALGGWLVTSYGLARDVLGRRDDFTVWAEQNLVRASLGVMMLTTDGDEHARMRGPFDGPFRMRAVRETFGRPVEDRVRMLLDEIEPRGECELAHDFAQPFAIGVAGDILGLSLDDVRRVQGFYDAFAGAMVYDGDPEPQRRADAARVDFNALLSRELARVRQRPDGSITSAVANDGAVALSDDEVIAQLRVILFGAIETVESMVLAAVSLLLQHPLELARVRDDPALVGSAVEEAMRLITPVAFIERWTLRPTTLGGVDLGPGEFIGVSALAGSRDPTVFADPTRFDVTRPNARHHLSFSYGEHHCLGFHMARLQGAAAVAAILERLPDAEVIQAPDPYGFAFRKVPLLGLRW